MLLLSVSITGTNTHSRSLMKKKIKATQCMAKFTSFLKVSIFHMVLLILIFMYLFLFVVLLHYCTECALLYFVQRHP